MEKTEAVEKIQQILSTFGAKNKVEILSNVLIFEGMAGMAVPSDKQKITPANVTEIVLSDRRENGETIHNALALQGLTMLMWIE